MGSRPAAAPPLPDWLAFLLDDTSALQAVFWLVAICSLVGVIVKLWPAVAQFVAIVNATAGLPAYIARADTRAAALERQVGEIHHEVHFNNGTSVKDAVIRVEKGVRGLYGKVDELAATDVQLRAELEDTLNPNKETRHD